MRALHKYCVTEDSWPMHDAYRLGIHWTCPLPAGFLAAPMLHGSILKGSSMLQGEVQSRLKSH